MRTRPEHLRPSLDFTNWRSSASTSAAGLSGGSHSRSGGGLALAANALSEQSFTAVQKGIVIVALVVIVVAHGLWEWLYVSRGAEPDRREGYSLAALQRRTLGIGPGEKMKPDFAPRLKGLGLIAYGWQVAITAALSAFVVLIIW
jgi:hypothetical protein